MNSHAHTIDAIIKQRRTHKQFAVQELKRQDLTDLLDLMRWAPNHRMVEPWRCYVLNRVGIQKLDQFFADNPHIASWPQSGKEHKLQKLRTHYLANLSAIIHVTAIKDADELKDRENYAACSAAVQNLLLGAEARGLASFWASSPAMRHPETQQWLGVNTDQEHFVGSIWLGQAVSEPKAPERSSSDSFTTWVGDT